MQLFVKDRGPYIREILLLSVISIFKVDDSASKSASMPAFIANNVM